MKASIRNLSVLHVKATLVLVSLLLATACGSSSKPSSSSDSISGNWQMSLTPSGTSFAPTQSGFLLESNGTVTGAMNFAISTACVGVGNVTGTVNGSDVSLLLSPSGLTVELTGTIPSTGFMTGNYTILSSGCSGEYSAPQTGTWTASQVTPLSGTIQGTFTSTFGPVYSMSGQLAQGSNTGVSSAGLSGNLATTGYCFFSSATLTGTISGTSVVLNIVGSDGTQLGEVVGTASLDGTLVTGTYKMLGFGVGLGYTPPCVNGDSGTVTLAL